MYLLYVLEKKIEVSPRDGGCAMNWALIAWLKKKGLRGLMVTIVDVVPMYIYISSRGFSFA